MVLVLDDREAAFRLVVASFERFAVIGEALHHQRDADIAKQPKRLGHVGRHLTHVARQPSQRIGPLARDVPKARELRAVGADHPAHQQVGDQRIQRPDAQHADRLREGFARPVAVECRGA
jgi:hypothetical protein